VSVRIFVSVTGTCTVATVTEGFKYTCRLMYYKMPRTCVIGFVIVTYLSKLGDLASDSDIVVATGIYRIVNVEKVSEDS
jgi:hypothetical protein